MGRVTIEIDEETEARIRDEADAAGVSTNKLILDLVRDSLRPGWPDEVRRLAGAWSDFPTAEEVREAPGRDHHRDVT